MKTFQTPTGKAESDIVDAMSSHTLSRCSGKRERRVTRLRDGWATMTLRTVAGLFGSRNSRRFRTFAPLKRTVGEPKGDYGHLHGPSRWGEPTKGTDRKGVDRDLIQQFRHTVADGRLKEPFRAADVLRARVRCAATTPETILPKHSVGNGRTTELLIRVRCGLYRLKHTSCRFGENT